MHQLDIYIIEDINSNLNHTIHANIRNTHTLTFTSHHRSGNDLLYPLGRGGKIGPTRWANPVRPKLRPGWAIKLLARKKPGQIWPGPVWPSPVWLGPPELFFALKRLFGPTGLVFRVGWTVKILARKNRANFGPAWFWPGPLLAQPSPARPARLPPLPLGLIVTPCPQIAYNQAMKWLQSYAKLCISLSLMDNYINMHIITKQHTPISMY